MIEYHEKYISINKSNVINNISIMGGEKNAISS
jgi:hypothetical protein